MTTLDPRALADSFAIYSIEDDEDSIRLSVNGEQIACWGANTDQGIALLKLEAARQESALPQPQAGEPVAHAYVVDGNCEEIAWGEPDYPDDPTLVRLYASPHPADERVVEALRDLVAAFELRLTPVERRQKTRLPYDAPLSAYDRAVDALAALSTKEGRS